MLDPATVTLIPLQPPPHTAPEFGTPDVPTVLPVMVASDRLLPPLLRATTNGALWLNVATLFVILAISGPLVVCTTTAALLLAKVLPLAMTVMAPVLELAVCTAFEKLPVNDELSTVRLDALVRLFCTSTPCSAELLMAIHFSEMPEALTALTETPEVPW